MTGTMITQMIIVYGNVGRDASENLRRIADTNGKEFKDLRDGFRSHYF